MAKVLKHAVATSANVHSRNRAPGSEIFSHIIRPFNPDYPTNAERQPPKIDLLFSRIMDSSIGRFFRPFFTRYLGVIL